MLDRNQYSFSYIFFIIPHHLSFFFFFFFFNSLLLYCCIGKKKGLKFGTLMASPDCVQFHKVQSKYDE